MKNTLPKIEVKKSHKRMRPEIKLFIFLGFCILAAWTLVVARFFTLYHLQNPILIKIETRKPYARNELLSPMGSPAPEVVKPEETPEQKKAKLDAELEWIYQETRRLESNVGKDKTIGATHNYCKSIGKVNEIGYFLGGNKKYCFENEQAQHDEFIAWMYRQMEKGITVNQAMCLYVTGKPQPLCQRVIALGLSGMEK